MKYVMILDYLYDGNHVCGVRDASGVYDIEGSSLTGGDTLTLDEIFENGSFVAFSESKGVIVKAMHRMTPTPLPF